MKINLVSSADWLSAHQGLRTVAELTQADLILRALESNGCELLDTRTGLAQRLDLELRDCLRGLAECEDRQTSIVVGLPPLRSTSGLACSVASELENCTVHSCTVAVDPCWIEDQLWDPADEQHIMLNLELDFVDTVLLTAPTPWSPQGASRRRGIDVVGALAPHATLIECPSEHRRVGRQATLAPHRLSTSLSRMESALAQDNSNDTGFSTVLLHSPWPLDTDAFYRLLPELAAGSVRIRGQLWLDSHLGERFHVQGCGPQVWLENRGPWDPGAELAQTRVSFTGEGLEIEMFQELLRSQQQFAELRMEGGAA